MLVEHRSGLPEEIKTLSVDRPKELRHCLRSD